MDRKRCQGRISGHETPIGWTPHWEDFNTEGLEGFGREDFEAAMVLSRRRNGERDRQPR